MTNTAIRDAQTMLDGDSLPAAFVRDAVPSDNEALIELAAASPMRGDLTLRMDRGPDFFALHSGEEEPPRVGVVDRAGKPVGCVAVIERRVYLNGVEAITGYAGDLKVHPLHRDTAIADALSRYAADECRSLPPSAPTLMTVLAGNRAMEKRLSGPRGLPCFRKLATIRTHSVGILWRRRFGATSQVEVRRADWRDIDDMTALWRNVAPARQFAPVIDALRFAALIDSSPGLDVSSYLLARGRDGRLLGFAAVWDQSSMKQMYVESYSRRLILVRNCFNTFAPLLGSEPMPRTGEPLRHQTVFHICVPPGKPDVLRAILVTAHNDLRHSRCSCLNIGLDTRDPLSAATEGLLAQPTDVNAYVTSVSGPVDVETLRLRPLHYEIALV